MYARSPEDVELGTQTVVLEYNPGCDRRLLASLAQSADALWRKKHAGGQSLIMRGMKVFLSWSGERSRRVAEALRDWLPNVLQTVKPWMSAEDIEKGVRWSKDVATELSTTTAGILCVTPENVDAPWLNFEAGALSKTFEQTFVCPYLIGGLRPSDLRGPLVQFQGTEASKADTRRLIATLNRALGDSALTEKHLDRAYDLFWPEFEKVLARIEEECQAPEPHERGDREILEEILGLVREQARRAPGSLEILTARYGARDQYVDVMKFLADRVSGGRLEVQVGNHMAGDPCVGEYKALIVDYVYAGQRLSKTIAEGSVLSLP